MPRRSYRGATGVHVLGAYHPIAMSGVFRSYPPAHTTEEVAALLRREFGRPVVRLDRVDHGVINAVYTARLSGGLDCFVKVAPRSRGTHALREEVWTYAHCRAVGVPTPEVLAFAPEPADFPEAYLITRRVPGENGHAARLDDEQRRRVLQPLG